MPGFDKIRCTAIDAKSLPMFAFFSKLMSVNPVSLPTGSGVSQTSAPDDSWRTWRLLFFLTPGRETIDLARQARQRRIALGRDGAADEVDQVVGAPVVELRPPLSWIAVPF